MKKRIAVDFGSSHCRAFVEREEGIAVLPSCAALERTSGKPVCYGSDAVKLTARTPGDTELYRPFTDLEKTEDTMLEGMLKEISAELDRPSGFRTDIILSFSGTAGEKTEERFLDAAMAAGAGNVTVVDGIFAAYRSLEHSENILLVHLGASCTEIGLFEDGNCLKTAVSQIGGKVFDDALGDEIYEKYGILLDDEGAEQLKIRNAAVRAEENAENKPFEVIGVHRRTGLPKRMEMTVSETAAILQPSFALLSADVSKLLASGKKPERVILSGGGAKMKGLREALEYVTGLPVSILREPENAVINGLQTMMEKGEV